MFAKVKKKKHPFITLTIGAVAVLGACRAVSAVRGMASQSAAKMRAMFRKAPKTE